MFEDPRLQANLGQLFSADSDRFDELIAAAGLDPKTDLVGADLRGANFAGSIMNGWDLSRCDLTGASFSGAKIRDLRTKDTIGLNLNGAILLDEVAEDLREPSDGFDGILEQIRRSTNGAQRGPLIENLLSKHGSDERTWSFLLGHQLRRERVGRYVSLIIDAWESTQPDAEAAGNELRLKLLSPEGNPYITVRARLLQELASRLGPKDEVLEVCKVAVEREGYWTSGRTAVSILAGLFSGDKRAASFLEELISRPKWSGFKSNVVRALFEGFDSASVRQVVENAILDESQERYQRSGMLTSYCRAKSDVPSTAQFAKRIFETSADPEIRAAAISARSVYGDLKGADASETLREIAIDDKDYQVRGAALDAIRHLGREHLDFLLQRATTDQSGEVRSLAVRSVAVLGYNNHEWFVKIFRDDPADLVRRAALDRLLSRSRTSNDEDKLRGPLTNEIERADPSFAAARAANEALKRWPGDSAIRSLVAKMLTRLPENTGGWKAELRSMLQGIKERPD
jgi:hypothetical protein